jgi:DNA-binding CsgD family transcriptional regulator
VSAPRPSHQTPLIERDAEIAGMQAALDDAAAGLGGVVLIEGPAGIGKTRLVAEAVRAAAERDLKVLRGRGGELEHEFAFGVVRQLLERELTHADPERREALFAGAAAPAGTALGLDGPMLEPGSDLGFPVLHALYWLMANLAAERPLVVVVDDAQWADGPSARFLAYLAPRAAELALLLVVASRPTGPDNALDLVTQLRAVPGAAVMQPAGLSDTAIGDLFRGRLDSDPTDVFVAACRSATGGNPFLLRELAGAAAADGIVPDDAGAAKVADLGPVTVSRSLLLRVAGRAPSATAVAKAVAVLGDDVELRHAAALAAIDEDEAAVTADALADAEILAPERPLRFIHPVVRAAVYGETGPGERTRLHARAAEILRDDGAPAERLVPHLLVTEPGGRPWAFAALLEAATGALSRGAPEVAVAALQRALIEPPPGDAERGQALAALGIAELCGGGDVKVGLARLAESLPLTPDRGARTFVRLILARVTWIVEDPPVAVQVLSEALDDLDPGDDATRAQLTAEKFGLGIIDPRTCEEAEALLDGVTPPPGDTTAERLVLANLATLRLIRGDDAQVAADLALRACADGELLAAEGEGSSPYQQAIYTLVLADRIPEAIREIDASLRTLRKVARPDDLFAMLAAHAMADWFAGDLASCEANALEAVDVPMLPEFALPAALMWVVLSLVERGDLDGAEQAALRAPPTAELQSLVNHNALIWGRAALLMARGRPKEALVELDELARRETEVHAAPPVSPWRPPAALAHLALGDRERAIALAVEEEQLARRWGALPTIGAALRVRGLAEGGDGGLDLLRESVTVLEASGARLEHARAVVDRGAALRRAGHRADARPILRDGVEAARRAGATALAQQAHEELRLAGAKPRRLQFSGVESLTAAERRVAELAAEGMANREIAQSLFVTGKTVENQLGRVYGKLGISSRRELAPTLAAGPEAA